MQTILWNQLAGFGSLPTPDTRMRAASSPRAAPRPRCVRRLKAAARPTAMAHDLGRQLQRHIRASARAPHHIAARPEVRRPLRRAKRHVKRSPHRVECKWSARAPGPDHVQGRPRAGHTCSGLSCLGQACIATSCSSQDCARPGRCKCSGAGPAPRAWRPARPGVDNSAGKMLRRKDVFARRQWHGVCISQVAWFVRSFHRLSTHARRLMSVLLGPAEWGSIHTAALAAHLV